MIKFLNENFVIVLSLLSNIITWYATRRIAKEKRKIDSNTMYLEQIEFLNKKYIELNNNYIELYSIVSTLKIQNSQLNQQIKSFESRQCLHPTRKCL